VPLKETRVVGIVKLTGLVPNGAANAAFWVTRSSYNDGKVLLVVFIPPRSNVVFVVPPPLKPSVPKTSQSPAVSEMLVIVLGALLTKETAAPMATDDVITSPTLPAFAALFVVVPTIPAVCDGVIVLLAVIVVNAPVLAVVAPTVPLMLMLAVPVRLVTVPLDGVPSAPPFTTNAPAVPVLTPSAVTTPVPVVVVAGVTPAPPPRTIAPAARAAEDAQVDALEKYGMPPEVPATVSAGVVVAVATVMIPPVKLTLVTVPLPLLLNVFQSVLVK